MLMLAMHIVSAVCLWRCYRLMREMESRHRKESRAEAAAIEREWAEYHATAVAWGDTERELLAAVKLNELVILRQGLEHGSERIQ